MPGEVVIIPQILLSESDTAKDVRTVFKQAVSIPQLLTA